jgi:hypothetical protein
MFVLQDWVSIVGLKMQSILLSGLRAPDQKTIAVKKCVRWLRGKCQKDGDPVKQSYMKQVEINEALIWAAMDELEYLPVHYVHHFADSFAVLGYFHPEVEVKKYALLAHNLVAIELFHFKPETETEFCYRHRDFPGSRGIGRAGIS